MDFANARYEAGLASHSDVLKAKVELSNANLSLIRIRNRRLSIQGALNVLIGQEPYKPIKIIDNLKGRWRIYYPIKDNFKITEY